MKKCPYCEEIHDHFCTNFSCKVDTQECFECHEEIAHPTPKNHRPSPWMLEAINYIMEDNIPMGNWITTEEDIQYLPRIPNIAWVRNPGVTFGYEGRALGNYFKGKNELLSQFFD
ncbi:MAG: hypothetical protein COU46_03320 [Candidatus Niyogibacteria bacterium CG10_big_fil_rev_8_21_14_0_10_42_19]|uniref:Uncharacterized protein n=1 Tax=Candidatus Niyogibacteria bacterium CG10_big_fil_rev_8_21_14_0_10_42_19 TaxID=1974725 RepID=A0A2H0TGY4_9BACT|nr:MAG: hypothetical protein COU46_03320 [Candidatus Niyogibacteria bacterium CG10_big_fil_rev_8_21_14_0_10_42_19]